MQLTKQALHHVLVHSTRTFIVLSLHSILNKSRTIVCNLSIIFYLATEPSSEGMEEEEKDVDLVFTDEACIKVSRNTETPSECTLYLFDIDLGIRLYCQGII